MSDQESHPTTVDRLSSETPAVGFAGLGRMGRPMAARLAQSGVPLIVYNRTQSKSEGLVSSGARWVTTPRELARSIGKGITFLIVTDRRAVRSVLFGRMGFARGAPAGALVVNLSTIEPEASRDFSARLGKQGVQYVDAPVGGSVDQASQGELLFYVGGEEAQVARVRPLLERLGRRVEVMGSVGAGNATKLVNNLLTIGNTVLSTEALALADGFHLDRARTIEVLLMGGARSSMLERKAPNFLTRQYPVRFATSLARKDLKLIEGAAAREGQSLKVTREVRRLLEEGIALGRAEEDFSSVLEATLVRRQPGPRATSPANPPPERGEPPAAGGAPV